MRSRAQQKLFSVEADANAYRNGKGYSSTPIHCLCPQCNTTSMHMGNHSFIQETHEQVMLKPTLSEQEEYMNAKYLRSEWIPIDIVR